MPAATTAKPLQAGKDEANFKRDLGTVSAELKITPAARDRLHGPHSGQELWRQATSSREKSLLPTVAIRSPVPSASRDRREVEASTSVLGERRVAIRRILPVERDRRLPPAARPVRFRLTGL